MFLLLGSQPNLYLHNLSSVYLGDIYVYICLIGRQKSVLEGSKYIVMLTFGLLIAVFH